MKRYQLILVFLFVFCSITKAQNHLPPNFFLSTLDNGLQILVVEDNSVPLSTIEICVKNGSYTESDEFNGLSHLYEHMFFKANKDIPSQEAYLKRVNELGIQFNGTTSEERVNYFFTMPVHNLDAGLQFMNSAIRYPLFLPSEMKKEDPVVDGEFQRAESDPTFSLEDKFNRKMWGGLYSRKNPIGDHQIILSATQEKMKVIQGKYYWPNNSILVIAGDVHHNEVFDKVKNIFGDWQPSGFDAFQKWPIPEVKPLGGDTLNFVLTNQNARVPIVFQGWHGPDTRNDVKSTYAADIFSTILGLASSKFQRELVDSGLALQAGLSYQSAKYTGPIQLFCVPNPVHLKECMKKLEGEINQFDNADYFTDEQLETAKNQLIIQDTYNKEKTSSYVHTVTFWWASASIDYYTTYNDMVKQVTRQDIQDYIHKYIKGHSKVSGILLPPQMQDAMKINSYNDLMN
ncbi:MAG: insulinase family protein [Chitinophagales bacterium]|nr:insulinase family protein [Chitinophagales bacterium]